MMHSKPSDVLFVDSLGNQYLVRDVPGDGDCALYALLFNPVFEVPLSGVSELRRGLVEYARGDAREACREVYSLVGQTATTTSFDVYLSEMSQPGFWVGTTAFIWATMAYGFDIRSHFFNEMQIPVSSSSLEFLKQHMIGYDDAQYRTVHVFFHKFRDMTTCKPAMYNHFAALISVRSMPINPANTLNCRVKAEICPWWLKDTSEKKGKKSKKEMNKDERKMFNKEVTLDYLKQADKGQHVAEVMASKLEAAQLRDAEIAAKLDVDVHDMDLAVHKDAQKPQCIDTAVTAVRTVTYKYDKRSWLQRATLIFLYLHPKFGKKNANYMSNILGVNEHTLLGWMTQKKFISGWVDLVDAMNVKAALSGIPENVQDYFAHVDPESGVSVKKYRSRIGRLETQNKLVFKGGKVRILS